MLDAMSLNGEFIVKMSKIGLENYTEWSSVFQFTVMKWNSSEN